MRSGLQNDQICVSSMAAGATLGRLDLPVFVKGLRLLHAFRSLIDEALRIQIKDVLRIAQTRGRITMALDAKRHAQWLHVSDDIHLVHLPVALDTGYAPVDVSGVIEISKIGRLMNPHPRYRRVLFVAFANRGE